MSNRGKNFDPVSNAPSPWKKEGVYLISGGAGGLGLLVASAIVSEANGAKIILVGRSPSGSKAIPEGMDYFQADVAIHEEVERLIHYIIEKYGTLNGIIHAAGVVKDDFILKKTESDFLDVLQPKISGVIFLDEATKDLPLDFFILFSSLAGAKGNPGQADYSTANAFLNFFTEKRQAQVEQGQRQGRTISINWPLWKEGGMKIGEAYEKNLKAMGMVPLETQQGIQAIKDAWKARDSRLCVLQGDLDELREQFLEKEEETATTVKSSVASVDITLKLEKELRELSATLLKMNIDSVDIDAQLSTYGFDSLLLAEFANQLKIKYKFNITPTVFFEYTTIRSLAGYLSKQYAAQFTSHVSGTSKVTAKKKTAVPMLQKERQASSHMAESVEPIAIVGVSGAFPMALNLDEYWQNLLEGRDCISEVPSDRWDWRSVWGDPTKEENKTNIKWGGFLDSFADFDPLFFGISPKEALLMDPSQRLLMEHAWMALEDAGYSAESLYGTKTGMFVGISNTGYASVLMNALVPIEGYTNLGICCSVGPNRMSYFLDIHGPSEPIETACSSSLVAIHRAVNSILREECDQAIVGGVNVIVSLESHISFSKAGMLCEDGHSKTFSKNANGYVRGEGVGMLFIKRLSAAERDHDHIYALIRGTAENHVGRANSLTAPSPKAQTEVIVEAHKKANTDPRYVSYMEAHGTGTKLGDPIEVQGLKGAFDILYQNIGHSPKENTCGLGSVKSNIGHLEVAAGMSGVLKIILQMKHQTLVKTLNSEEQNPYINLEGSPLYIVRENRRWERPQNEAGKVMPRIAGVSGFSFSGANAHVVLEEYIPPYPITPSTTNGDESVVIILSARKKEQLQEYAKRLLRYVEKEEPNIVDMAFTLQVGRMPLEERLGLIVKNLEDLKDKLRSWLDGHEKISGIYCHSTKSNKDVTAIFEEDNDLFMAIEKWLEHKKYDKLVEFWTKGLHVDWHKLYMGDLPWRISLPTYPFVRERYWVEGSRSIPLNATATPQLHPLLQENHSTLFEGEFCTNFNGEEFFLKDHVVKGHKIFPEAAYLEMAFAAIRHAIKDEPKLIELKNIVWSSPIIATKHPLIAHIKLIPEDNVINFEVYTQNGEDFIVHSSGQALCLNGSAQTSLNLTTLQDVMPIREVTAQECYEVFEKMGLHYGTGFQSIEFLRILKKGILAKLKLPSYLGATLSSYTLHPSLLDGALQASIGLFLQEAGATPLLPFALDSITIYNPCRASMWAWVQRAESISGSQTYKLDIDLCNDEGLISARLVGLSLRLMEEKSEPINMLMLHPIWMEKAAGPHENTAVECRVIEFDTTISFEEQALRLFDVVRSMIQEKPENKQLLQVVIYDPLQFGLSGLLKTAHLECSKFYGQLILIENEQSKDTILKENQHSYQDVEVQYRQGKRYARSWEECKQEFTIREPWKDGGVYLLTGGAGGLGRILAKEISMHARNVKIILAGRSAINEDIQNHLRVLRLSECLAEYFQVDISNQASVQYLINDIIQRYGTLNGIFHLAGIAHPNYIVNKSVDEVAQVLQPKIAGTIHLDETTKEIPLDFFILFSSISTEGVAGEGDYAMASSFMDYFANVRQLLVAQHKRQGRTLSVNWPLWQEGGMQLTESEVTHMRLAMGWEPLETQAGIKALLQAWSSEDVQELVLMGDIDKLKRSFLQQPSHISSPIEVEEPELAASIQKRLKEMTSSLVKIRIEELDATVPLSDFGFDSINLTEFSNRLNSKYDLGITPSVFFEHATLESLAAYFSKNFASKWASQTQIQYAKTEKIEREELPHHSIRQLSRPQPSLQNSEPIAIIGMSGAFPMAHNLEELWQNLIAGKDCISEIPPERWDWHAIWGDPSKEDNVTNVKWGGFLDTATAFDSLFFGISPREAFLMDPQQRLLMEYAWLAIEDAGYSAESLSGSNTGIFVGTSNSGYGFLLDKAGIPLEGYSATGEALSIGPNRTSYFLNLHGPSEPIDTACSSSLVAIHHAVKAIQTGDCNQAIVGGVNVLVSPGAYISLSKAGMICEDGRCKTFSKYANGYARGEGVGMLFLKKLKDAEAEGDHIYAIIRGSAENHGGRANSLTAPNSIAQADLLVQAYTNAGINPRDVSYIEAHGTGTELGDPVEVGSLKAAFAELGVSSISTPYCGLGTVKSNIGHLELAAGIAGVIKVVLQMQHQTLVKTLHAEEQNPYINLEGSPFYILRDNRAWVTEYDANGHPLPRIAGISSFGFGGVNAHVIIEEYIPRQHLTPSQHSIRSQPAIILLSARNKERLMAMAKNLLAFIQHNPDTHLADIAFTLQVGRTAMEERLGFLADTLEELKEKLGIFIAGKEDLEGIYCGPIKPHKMEIEPLETDTELRGAVNQWIEHKKLVKLVEFWVKGLHVNWVLLHEDPKPKRINLPLYPFEREIYWTTGFSDLTSKIASIPTGRHPLLLREIHSPLLEAKVFESEITNSWPSFIPDHQIYQIPVVAGAVYLSTLMAAAKQLWKQSTYQIEQIEFFNPIILLPKQTIQVQTIIYPGEEGVRSFEILHCLKEEPSPSHNWVVNISGVLKETPILELGKESIDAILSRCPKEYTQEVLYQFASTQLKLDLGKHFQWMDRLFVGENELLCRMRLPSGKEEESGYVLYPGFIDSCFQVMLGKYMLDPSALTALVIPFSIEQFLYDDTRGRPVWVYATHIEQKGDILKGIFILLNEDGQVVGKVTGFVSKTAPRQALLKFLPEYKEEIERLMFFPSWKEKAISAEDATMDHRLITLDARGSFEESAIDLFKEIRNILQQKLDHPLLLQVAVHNPLQCGLSALLKTAHLENPNFYGQLILLEEHQPIEPILEENRASAEDTEIKYEQGKRYVKAWKEHTPPSASSFPWKDNGVYLITGGAGGLGLIFAKEIASHVHGAKIILVGRSVCDDEIQTHLEMLRSNNCIIDYHQADISNRESVDKLIDTTLNEYGFLNGILHAAGIIRDNYIVKKTDEEFKQVLQPKVSGTIYLDEATKELPLDFFILFSSIAGALGNAGQADYAAANSFMDAFAYARQELVAQKLRQGFSLSLNWPLWKEGGMHLEDSREALLEQVTGMVPLDTQTGLRAFSEAWASYTNQLAIIQGAPSKIHLLFNPPTIKPKQKATMNGEQSHIQNQKVSEFLQKLIASVVKMDASSIQVDQPLDKYGIDSLLVMQITQLLENQFGTLPKTLLFEYQTIHELSMYFMKQYSEKLNQLLNTDQLSVSFRDKAVSFTPTPQRQQKYKHPLRSASSLSKPLDIAIIGISGRYPQSPNLDIFWKNLSQGVDCITEIPPSRWDWHDYYDPNKLLGKHSSKWGGFIDDVEYFDPLFFNISPRDAAMLDPQERLFLEEVWKALEDSGYRPEDLKANPAIGVYVGAMWSEYQLYGPERNKAFWNVSATIANRISYYLDCHGPSIALDTMCSSSLTALHLACEDLKNGRIYLGIAGGVNVTIHPNKYLQLSGAQIISSSAHNCSFGEGSDGYIPSEGVGAVILKRLDDAITDRDHIYAIIKGSAINHGGKTRGFTVPNPNAQSSVIQEALQVAQIHPTMVSYIEAQGTGTKLGDPIEIAGLNNAFKEYKDQINFPIWIGSAKSNIGHCESAGGIAGLTKVILQMQHKQIVPSLNSKTLNPFIDFEQTPFKVNQELRAWDRPIINGKEYPRIAGLSAFGAGGSNAHLIIQEYIPAQERRQNPAEHSVLIVLSARNKDRLLEYARTMLVFLKEHDDLNLDCFAYTLQVGREAMDERLGMVISSFEELKEKLQQYIQGRENFEGFLTDQIKRNRELIASFTKDQAFNDTVNLWIANKQLTKLLELWVKGFSIEWSHLYENSIPERISLPTYPFARERYWIDTSVSTAPTISLPTQAQSSTDETELVRIISIMLQERVANLLNLKIEDLDLDSPLTKYGFDSITFVEFANQLNNSYNLELTPAILLEHSTIESFSKFLVEKYTATFSQLAFKENRPEGLIDKVQPSLNQVPEYTLPRIKDRRVDEHLETIPQELFDYDLHLIYIPGSTNRTMICLHGYQGNYQLAQKLHAFGFLPSSMVGFNFPEYNIQNVSKTPYGTLKELKPLFYVLWKYVIEKGLESVDIYGFSAGGGAFINALLILNSNKNIPYLKALGIGKQEKARILKAIQKGVVILDSPLKSIEEIVDLRGSLGKLEKLEKFEKIAKKYLKSKLIPIDNLLELQDLTLNILLFFQNPDEVLSNRDDALFAERLSKANSRGITKVIVGNDGGHESVHWTLWKYIIDHPFWKDATYEN